MLLAYECAWLGKRRLYHSKATTSTNTHRRLVMLRHKTCYWFMYVQERADLITLTQVILQTRTAGLSCSRRDMLLAYECVRCQQRADCITLTQLLLHTRTAGLSCPDTTCYWLMYVQERDEGAILTQILLQTRTAGLSCHRDTTCYWFMNEYGQERDDGITLTQPLLLQTCTADLSY